MPIYDAPIREIRFLLEDVFNYEQKVTTLPGFEDASLDVVMAVLDSAADFVKEVVLPLNLPGDDEGCSYEQGKVRTPAGYKAAYALYCQGGWPSLASDPTYGGQGLPPSLGLVVRELVAAGSMSFGMYAGLSQGAYRAILAHGTARLKQTYLPKLVDGSWTGTMCLTEPEAGSDLSRLRTRATPAADGSYRLTGTKIFISGGDHDLADNIVHLVLARLPDAPAGTRGISLFAVPKHVPGPDGSIAASAVDNVTCGSIEHKMGIRASATAVLNFDEAQGWLVGEPHAGMRAMFTMMNSSRIGVAVQSVGASEISYQNALAYAKERRQGRADDSASRSAGAAANGAAPIIGHPDVRRMLLTMKALVEGVRALYIESALDLDVKAAHPDPETRVQADARLALLTPVLKSFISDCAVQVTDLGIQVFGGHGYVHENGMEHLFRDARIVPLYEGTNGIQALDLVGRKIGLDGGRALDRYIGALEHVVERNRATPATASMAAALAAALTNLRAATTQLHAWGLNDPVQTGGAASDYLRLFGLVALGGVWLKMAETAAAAIGTEPGLAAFYNGKIKTADFYFTRLLPEAQLRYQAICTGAACLMALSPQEF
jgi:alkylation response protein AidB-like acyl-CoA dehydrogenase